LRNAAYCSQPANGWLEYAANVAASSVPRLAASKAPRKPASGIAISTGGLAARGGGTGACARALPLAHRLASSRPSVASVSVCIAGL